MCGIAGIWGKSDFNHIDSMVSSMYHRGPDDKGIYQDDQIALGMTRLAVIDTHPSGHQPMSTPDGKIWIVYNGEVYNFKQERQILESYGYSFQSNSDTEVVLRMYEYYGDDFLIRLRGMFAFAIYDKRGGIGRERLYLARDQFGIKPLLYTEYNGNFIFGSEIKSILASNLITPKINMNGLRLLLAFGSVYQPNTILENVYMLLPAHRIIIENGKEKRIERYWSLGVDRINGVKGLAYEKQVDMLDNILRETVSMQMISDVPLGAFLSGGLDSAIIVAMMSKVSDHKVKTFSIGFESEGYNIDESEESKKTADYIGTDHSQILVKGSDISSHIRSIASGLDQPSVDGVNSYFVSMAARRGVTVSISGTGSDEIFAGYPWFASMYRYQKQSYILKMVRKILQKNYRENDFLSEYAAQYNIFGSDGAKFILDSKLWNDSQAGTPEYMDLKLIDELSNESVVNRVSGLVLRGYTNNQLLRDIDAVSMSHSLEVRVPYLDLIIADFALSLPDIAKLNITNKNIYGGGTYRSSGSKCILVDVGKRYLQKDFDLKSKRGFGMPFDAWLQGSLNTILEDTLSNQCVRERGLFNVEKVKSIKDKYLQRKTGWSQPWLLMMIELWCQEILDKFEGD